MIVNRYDLDKLDFVSMPSDIKSLYRQTKQYIERKGGETYVNPNILRTLGVPLKEQKKEKVNA